MNNMQDWLCGRVQEKAYEQFVYPAVEFESEGGGAQ